MKRPLKTWLWRLGPSHATSKHKAQRGQEHFGVRDAGTHGSGEGPNYIIEGETRLDAVGEPRVLCPLALPAADVRLRFALRAAISAVARAIAAALAACLASSAALLAAASLAARVLVRASIRISWALHCLSSTDVVESALL